MPYTIRKIRNQEFYQVVNLDTGRIMAKHSTRENATRQIRLLRMLHAQRRKLKFSG